MRRSVLFLAAIVLLVVGIGAVLPRLDDAVQEVTLPLRHDDIIRQQAEDKDLDPALIAAVIYAESRFRDATSSAGRAGLMQITPETAREIAQRSGGTRSSRATSPSRRSTSPTARTT
jgi:soluble lytic murein transglycosylase